MGKLHQIIAVVASKKSLCQSRLTEAYHKIQTKELFNGLSRTYHPKDEDGERLPPESKVRQTSVADIVGSMSSALVDLFDTVATQDIGNCSAKADVVVQGELLLADVPVTTLLFLEKQLVDLRTFISKLPVLDPSETWSYSDNLDCYVSETSETARTKKIERPFVLYEATKEHPAQVKVATEDVVVGYWKQIKFSGAVPAKVRNDLLDRVRKLHEAVVRAREDANSIEVQDVQIGRSILNYVFEGVSVV